MGQSGAFWYRCFETGSQAGAYTEEEIGECLKAQGKEEEAEKYFKLAYEKRLPDSQD